MIDFDPCHLRDLDNHHLCRIDRMDKVQMISYSTLLKTTLLTEIFSAFLKDYK